MCFFVNFSFDHNYGSFPLQIPSSYFLLGSSCLSRASNHFPHRPLKLRSTIATNSRVVLRAAAFPYPQSHGDSSSDENIQGRRPPQRHQGSSSADVPSPDTNPTPLRAASPPSPSSSSPSSPPSSSSSPQVLDSPLKSPGNSATVPFESNSGNQFVSASSSSSNVQTRNCDIAGVPSVNPSKQLSHMSKGIKTAFGMLQGWKTIQKLYASSAEGALFVSGAGNWVVLSVKATKFFAKGLKLSQKVLTSKPFSKLIFKDGLDGGMIEKLVCNDLTHLANGFNAFYAAIKVAEFSKSLRKRAQEGELPHSNLIWKGYKFSKSLVSILDAVVGKNGLALTYMGKGFVIVKKAIGGIGVMVKAIFLSKELGPVLLKRVAISGGTFAAVLGTYHQTSRSKPPMEVTPQSKSSKPLCMRDEVHVCDWAVASSCNPSVKNENLFSWVLLFGFFTEELEDILVNFPEDDDPQTVLCLALPLRNDEFLVSGSFPLLY